MYEIERKKYEITRNNNNNNDGEKTNENGTRAKSVNGRHILRRGNNTRVSNTIDLRANKSKKSKGKIK